jgi:hypothetical protein
MMMSPPVLLFYSIFVSAVVLLLLPMNFQAFRAFHRTNGNLLLEPLVRWGRMLWGFSILAAFSGPIMPVLSVGIILAFVLVRFRYQDQYPRIGEAIVPLKTAAINAVVFAGASLAMVLYLLALG